LLPTDVEIKTNAKEELEQELSRLTEEGGGTLLAVRVVDAARPPRSTLHRYFEWDDSIAGEAYRLIQAGALIRSVRVISTIETIHIATPKYVHNAELVETGRAGYRELFSLRTDQAKKIVLLNEMSLAMAHLRRAGSIALVLSNRKLHSVLTRVVTRMEAYLESLVKEGTAS